MPLNKAMERWEKMGRERDAWIWENVMDPDGVQPVIAPVGDGNDWGVWMDNGEHDLPHYSTSPSDDYRVLEKVRETWGARDGHFIDALAEIWKPRDAQREGVDVDDEYHDVWLTIHYRPGDYSLAAFLVLEGQKEVGV